MSDISTRRHQIDTDRLKKQRELMDEYDRTVYYPAKQQLIKDCEKEGHTKAKFHDNGWGWTWWWCGKCGTAFDKKEYKLSEE